MTHPLRISIPQPVKAIRGTIAKILAHVHTKRASFVASVGLARNDEARKPCSSNAGGVFGRHRERLFQWA